MSFGVSLSDFFAAYELANKLYHTCFTKAQRADVKYIQFGSEIRSLGDSSKQLHDIVTNADKQPTRRPWDPQDLNHITNSATVKALSQVTGDFLRTLKDCERLLSNNFKFERTKAGFVDNVKWHSSTEREVKSLRQRVHFHQIKISFIAKPFEVQLLLDIRSELKYLRRDVAELLLRKISDHDAARASDSDSSRSSEDSLTVSPDLASRFTEALSVNKPATFHVQEDLPLSEGFDALIFHFANSTVNFNPNPVLGQNTPEEPQYLNLLKSKWILEKLKGSVHFRSAGQESLWAEYMREIEGQIRIQLVRFQRNDIFTPSSEILSQLPDNCFNIWVVEGPSHPAALTEEQPLEEKILELHLTKSSPTRQSTLTIFRKSDVTFRLVSTTKDDQNKDYHREESADVNMTNTRLIPAFAACQNSSNANNNVRLCGIHSQPECYALRDSEDVALFQRALMGFRISHDMSNVNWYLEYQDLRKSAMSGNARLQLWHLKPLPKIPPPGESQPTGVHESSTVRSAHSPTGSANLRQFWTSSTSQTPGSAIVSPVIGSSGSVLALLRPELPVLVIFTECEKKYSFFHLQLEEHVFLEKQPCMDCINQQRPCSRVLIKHKTKRLNLRRFRAEQESESGLDSWDLAYFRHPEHPRFKNLETLKIKYISLHFIDQQNGDEFCKEFKLLENLRNKNLIDYERDLNERKFAANNLR